MADFDPASEPLGSPSPLVRDLNTRNLDRGVNSEEMTWLDRFGVERPTFHGMKQELNGILIAGGRIFDTPAQGRNTVEDNQYYYVISSDPNVSRSIYQRISASQSAFIKDEPATPLVFQNEKTGKGARFLIHGDLTKKEQNENGDWVISHGELLVLRGPGRGPVYIEPASNVIIPIASLYYADLNNAPSEARITAKVTNGNSNSMENGLGAFIEDLKINLFSYRSSGVTGVLGNRFKPVNEYPAVNLIWFPIGNGVVVAYDSESKTLSWSARIVGINRMGSISRNAIVLEPHSVVIPSNNYTVVWLDMTQVGSGAIDVTAAVKVGSYQGSDPDAYRGLSYQIPMFISGARGVRPAPGFFENDIQGIYYPADTSGLKKELDTLDSRVAELEAGEVEQSAAFSGRGGFPVYLESGAIMKLGLDGEETLIDVSPNSFLREPQWKGAAILAVTDKPSLTNTTPVFVSVDGALIHPSSPELLGVIVGHGQSNSRGNRGYIGDYIDINPRYENHALMFDGPGTGDKTMDVRLGLLPEDFEEPIDAAILERFQPLRSVDKIGMGTTFLEGGAATLHTMLDQQLGYLADYLYYTAGRGGTALSGLEVGTVPFQNFVIALERANVLAEQLGKRLWVPAIFWMQGESNVGTADYMQQLHDNVYQPMVTEIKRITGQILAPRMFYMQPSSFTSTSAAIKDMFNNAETYPDIKLVGASYPCPFSFDCLHQNRVGQFKIGEYMARAALNICFGKSDWRPLMPVSATLISPTQIEVEFHVPVGPLVVDTSVTAKDEYWGFELRNGTTDVPISSISMSGNVVTIESSTTLTAGDSTVRYALNGQTSPRTEDGVPRGQLRDSDPTKSLADGSPLYNWCVHFEEVLQ